VDWIKGRRKRITEKKTIARTAEIGSTGGTGDVRDRGENLGVSLITNGGARLRGRPNREKGTCEGKGPYLSWNTIGRKKREVDLQSMRNRRSRRER